MVARDVDGLLPGAAAIAAGGAMAGATDLDAVHDCTCLSIACAVDSAAAMCRAVDWSTGLSAAHACTGLDAAMVTAGKDAVRWLTDLSAAVADLAAVHGCTGLVGGVGAVGTAA